MKHYSDTRYTELFSHPVFVKGLLVNFVHESFARELDFSRMEPYKTKFVTEAYARRESDVIWKVLFQGKDVYLFLLIEFQSTVDRRMPIRLLRYIAEFYDSLPGKRAGDLYPAVFPIVLYNGSAKWTAKTDFAELIESTIPSVYVPNFHYYVIEERSFSSSTLLEMRNLVSLLFYAETVSAEHLMLRLNDFFDILKNEDLDAVRLFSHWLNDFFRQMAQPVIGEVALEPSGVEEPTMLAESLRTLFEKAYREGSQKGLADGLEQGIERGSKTSTRTMALRLIARGTTLDEVAAIVEMSVDELRVLIDGTGV